MRLFWFVTCSVFILPGCVFAQVISEVMFDPEGPDGGFEWIEIYNSSSLSIDLSEFKLREQESNHYIKNYSGPTIVDPGEYAIIADRPENLDFSGVSMFDSAFSLLNKGESLALVLGDNTIFEKTYMVSEGFISGESLHYVDGSYVSGKPSPGSSFQGGGGASDHYEDKAEVVLQEKTKHESYSKPFYFGRLDLLGSGFAGIPHRINFDVFYEKSGDVSELRSGKFSISFGDGDVENFEELTDLLHTYEYPGTYIISASFTKGVFDAEPTVFMEKTIQVNKIDLEIIREGEEFFLAYSGKSAILLEDFVLASNLSSYTFDPRVKLPPGGKIPISSKIGGRKGIEKIALISPSLSVSAVWPGKKNPLTPQKKIFTTSAETSQVKQEKQESKKLVLKRVPMKKDTGSIPVSGSWRLVGVLGILLAGLMYGRTMKKETTNNSEEVVETKKDLREKQEDLYKEEASLYSIFDENGNLVCGPEENKV